MTYPVQPPHHLPFTSCPIPVPIFASAVVLGVGLWGGASHAVPSDPLFPAAEPPMPVTTVDTGSQEESPREFEFAQPQAPSDPPSVAPVTEPNSAFQPVDPVFAPPADLEVLPQFPVTSPDVPDLNPPAESDTPAQSPADETIGRLIGQVFNELGQPIAGAQIRLGQEAETVADEISAPPEQHQAGEFVTVSPQAGEFVTVSPQAESTPEVEQPFLIETDEQGGFELNTTRLGRWPLTVWHPDYETLETEIWILEGFTTPVDIVLKTPLVKQPQTRLGVLGVGSLDHTKLLSQRLATEAVRQQLIPQTESVVPLDNRKLLPVLRKVGHPLYELFEWDRRRPEAVEQFFDYLGLKAIVITRVDVLSQPSSPEDLSLQSRSRLELWTFDDSGTLQAAVIGEASRSETEENDLNAAEVAQLYQIQVTQMAEEVGTRWQEASPVAAYLDIDPNQLQPSTPSTLDTTVELQIPNTTLPGTDPESPDISTDPGVTSDPSPEAVAEVVPTPTPTPDPTPTPEETPSFLERISNQD